MLSELLRKRNRRYILGRKLKILFNKCQLIFKKPRYILKKKILLTILKLFLDTIVLILENYYIYIWLKVMIEKKYLYTDSFKVYIHYLTMIIDCITIK